jgi:hypothetical protein
MASHTYTRHLFDLEKVKLEMLKRIYDRGGTVKVVHEEVKRTCVDRDGRLLNTILVPQYVDGNGEILDREVVLALVSSLWLRSQLINTEDGPAKGLQYVVTAVGKNLIGAKLPSPFDS